MSDAYRVETSTVDGGPTALGRAGTCTVVIDRPASAGGNGLGFTGGQLLNLAVAACISNDLYREAAQRGIELSRVRVTVDADYVGDPAVSMPIEYDLEIAGEGSPEALADLVDHVDAIAEIPNSLRAGTDVRLRERRVLTA
jgi:putative redox protein